MKRIFDLVFALPLLVLLSPVIMIVIAIVWLSDLQNPIYLSRRVGLHGRMFPLFKIRTMVIGADRTGVDTTVDGDPRLIRVGAFLRRFKLDELPQLLNVVLGQMSVVGPRPNVPREVEKYTGDELRLFTVKPGITDFASIYFSDLGVRLAGQTDANTAYETQIRPTKSALALFYIDVMCLKVDLFIIFDTVLSMIHKDIGQAILIEKLRTLGFDVSKLDAYPEVEIVD